MSTNEDGAFPRVEVVDPTAQASAEPPPEIGPEIAPETGPETVMDPAKLLRIASMVRQLLDDTRQATLDEAGRKRLADIYQRSVSELGESISHDLKEELAELAPPLGGEPSESEIRIAQAQLVGWLEGLFHGIQAAMFAQQAAARQQFEELRRRGLPGSPTDQPEQPAGPQTRGQYL